MFGHRKTDAINICLLSSWPFPSPLHFYKKGFYYEKAIRFHRWAADYAQALIEGTYGRKMKKWGGLVDSLINNLVFETRDIHLRQEAGANGKAWTGKGREGGREGRT